jgi:hypothetical protein
MRPLTTPLELTLPADNRLIRLARLVASGVATACGLPLEAVEDFRIVVDEICSTLIESSAAGSVHLLFRINQDSLVVEGTTQTAAHRDDGAARLALSHQILDVLTDAHQVVQTSDHLTIVTSIAQPAQGVG